MKTSFLPTDVDLSLPIIIFPIGRVGGNSFDILNGLHCLSFNCSLDSDKYPDLKQVCQSKNVPLPKEIRSTIFILNDESDFSKIHFRFQLEPSLLFLKWFVVIVFIDGVLNNDIPRLQEYVKTLSISSDTNHFFHYFIFAYGNNGNNVNRDIFEKYKTDDQLFFFFLDNKNDKNESNLISSIIDFLCPLIVQSIQNHVAAIVTTDNVSSRKKMRTNKSVSAIPRASLTFLSSSLPDKVKIFTETIKIFENEKNVDNQKYGEMYELLGILEMEHPGTAKKYQLLDRIPNIYHWELEEKNDILLLFSLSASYFMKNLPLRALDCCFRIFSFFYNSASISATSNSSNNTLTAASNGSNSNISASNTAFINNKTITFLIDECIVILEKLNDEDLMQNHGLELIAHISRLGQIRKIPMVCYQISKILRFRAKADFLLMGIRFIYEQNQCSNNQLLIQNLVEPMVEILLKSVVFPLEKCSVIFKILSTIGDFLPKEKQDFLFMKMIDLSIGDVRIPCDIGLKVSYARIIPPSIEIIEINSIEKSQSNSIFLYNCLQKKPHRSITDLDSSASNIAIGVGSQFRIEFDLYNSFSLDLPVFISCTKTNHCSSEDYPCPLKAKSNNTLVCCLTPFEEGEIVINSVDCVIYSGVQKIIFPYTLKVKAIDGVASFSVRTELPIKQTIELYDGEVYRVRMWITNTGSCEIDNLSLRFDPSYLKLTNKMHKIYDESEISKVIPPSENILVNLDFEIVRQMESISFDVVAQTPLNKSYEAVCHVEQPINVNLGLNIISISLLNHLPENRFDQSRFVFVAVNIKNNTEETFHYTASFSSPSKSHQNIENNQIKFSNNDEIKNNKNSKIDNSNSSNNNNDNGKDSSDDDINFKNNDDDSNDNDNSRISDDKNNNGNSDEEDDNDDENNNDFNYLGVLSSKPRKGLFIGNETTTLILPIAKSDIENPPICADRAQKISAARSEEVKLGQKLTNKQRKLLDLRVDMAEFIKASLNFKWKRGGVRQGKLSLNSALPAESLLKEVEIKRPQTICSFCYIDSNENLAKIQTKRKVSLNVCFKFASVKVCKIDLGIYEDSDNGIMWNGLLEREKINDDGDNCFKFLFYFVNPGKFTFTIKYVTFDSVKGSYPIKVNVI
ncbi:hypothetical protein M9Y10_038074 [Tritrichomonas musculus]|uniref:Uncharacterized protein n=1 Tax=Tritrichomonas musculus TaxID=1915356 RepID=A0ABR2K861_9EUKA